MGVFGRGTLQNSNIRRSLERACFRADGSRLWGFCAIGGSFTAGENGNANRTMSKMYFERHKYIIRALKFAKRDKNWEKRRLIIYLLFKIDNLEAVNP